MRRSRSALLLGVAGFYGFLGAMAACSGTQPTTGPGPTSSSGGILTGAQDAPPGQDPLAGVTQDRLAPLGNAPTFNMVTGLLTVTVSPGELGMISLGPVGAPILVNGVQPVDATPVTGGPATKLSVVSVLITETGTGTPGTTEVIVDYTNGIFAPTTVGPVGGITLKLTGAEPAIFGIKGQNLADNIVFGTLGVNVSAGVNMIGPDIIWDTTARNGGAGTFIVSMGDGDDYWSAGGDPAGTSTPVLGGRFNNDTPAHPAPNFPAKGVEIFGGAGNDTFDETTVPTPFEAISGGGQAGDTVDYSSRTTAVNVALGVLGVATSATALSGHCSAAGSGGSCATDEHDDISSDVLVVNGGSGNDYFTAFSGTIGSASDGGTDAASDAHTDAAATTDAHSDAATADAGVASQGAGPTFNGNDGDDTFTPYGGTYFMNGGNGNDVFLMGTDSTRHGPGVVAGGPGVDTVDFSGRTTSVHVTMDAVGAMADAGLPVVYTGTLDGTYNGTIVTEGMLVDTTVDNLKGGAGNDLLSGNALDNVINGGLGADVIHGNGGSDTVDYSDRGSAVALWVALDGVAHSGASSHQVRTFGTAINSYTDGACTPTTGTGADGGAPVSGSDENDTIATDIQNIVGGAGNDCLFGQPVAFSCTGTVCQNNLTGGPGDDMLFGYEDNDVLEGAGGAGDSVTAKNYLDCGNGTLNIARDVGVSPPGYRAGNCQF